MTGSFLRQSSKKARKGRLEKRVKVLKRIGIVKQARAIAKEEDRVRFEHLSDEQAELDREQAHALGLERIMTEKRDPTPRTNALAETFWQMISPTPSSSTSTGTQSKRAARSKRSDRSASRRDRK